MAKIELSHWIGWTEKRSLAFFWNWCFKNRLQIRKIFKRTQEMAPRHSARRHRQTLALPSIYDWARVFNALFWYLSLYSGNTKGGSITVLLTSCLTGLKSAVWQLTIFVFISKTDLSKLVKQEVNSTVILPPLVFPALLFLPCSLLSWRLKRDSHPNDTQLNDIQHNKKLNTTLSLMTLSITVECCYAECHLS